MTTFINKQLTNGKDSRLKRALLLVLVASLLFSCSRKPETGSLVAGTGTPTTSASSIATPSKQASPTPAANLGPMLAQLKDKSAKKREEAARLLGQTRDTRALEPLLAALKDSSGDVRLGAADALGYLKDTRAVDALIAALKDRAIYVRPTVATSLGKIGNARAVDALIASLGDQENDYASAYAADALAEIGAPALEPLLEAVRSKRLQVREYAARALGQMDTPRAHEPLLTALRDKNLELIAGAYRFFLRRGESGTEGVLIAALNRSSANTTTGYQMAIDLLNCGNSQLEEAAQKWARRNDYRIEKKTGLQAFSAAGRPTWGNQ